MQSPEAGEEKQAANVLNEADRLTSTDRQQAYGHPLDDFTRTAALFNAAFANKIREPFAPEDIVMVMLLVKMSRQRNKPGRDNLVDLCGYTRLIEMIEQEREKRRK